ncbi:Response regulator receiver modulated diguanylate cyclase/phosphodiesterase with PAS/PAC sensor(S) [Hyella patelloides LEGE 07179]|uniref:Response regulator receiver modulated diguanylate cyclase/phosphodiesterase with PAS/PAC sensor(S) n=1 Tax=Hyella patelloides LEGE 07179 TaxID=945734 RepID=A0A563VJM3_9CYAN|nr:EAL domain-containing protein [Hyella patelloides]VEP11628.1 Response regulator receiver modulated diguanylate cyclase/phosphodiesterase with PAS/PAC sensor(S) [Hyella patelloides LEGE 07179]
MSEKAIVCVDDDEIILNSLGEQLKRAFGDEYTIELASSGAEAMELFAELVAEEVEIPLIISDQNMAAISGDKLLIQLHDLYPETLKILLTGESNAEVIRNLVNVSALYRYIAKPWDETDLILTVTEALRCYEQGARLNIQNQLLLEANQKLGESLALLVATLEATADGILVVNNQGQVIRCNQKFLHLWGIANYASARQNQDRIIDLALQQIKTPYTCNLDSKETVFNYNNYSLLELKNGKVIECYSQTQQLQDLSTTIVWSFRDVTERQKAEQTIKYQAFHDTLTGLANRSLFNCKLASALQKSHQSQNKLAVLFFDLDRFKTINDTLGHAIGDRLLQAVVERLLSCIRDGDTISRWGGDEFTLLLPHIHALEDATAIAARILQALQPPFDIESHRLHVTSSMGIAIYPDHGTDSDTLLKNADAALYKAKDRGRNNYQYYNQTINSQGKQLLQLENRLRYALNNQEFILYYQPIVDITTGKIAKMEALLRWQHPKLGLITPNIFIPLAEENGLIVPIGEWVLEKACLQNKYWQKIGLSPLTIAVNLSPRQFQESDLVDKVIEILQKTGLQTSYLELEITETVTIQNGDIAKNILTKFKEMEISLAMDDFGTGYSSLSYLRQFPFNTLKVDRSFIKNILEAPEDRAIIKAIISLGQGLGISVVAEGIETVESKNFLHSLGCRYMQGYYFSRPVAAKDATQLLQNQDLIVTNIKSV